MTAVRAVLAVAASRRVTPVVLAGFFLLYLGLAFTTDETLVELMGLVKGSPLLLGLLSLVPLNIVARLAAETREFLLRRRAMGGGVVPEAGLFAEEVAVNGATLGESGERWLRSAGYRTVLAPGRLAASRGVSLFPSRVLLLIGAAAIFTGIILSLAGRETVRDALIEGEPLPPSIAAGGTVGNIQLQETDGGVIFARELTIGVTAGDGTPRKFGLYPPGRTAGWFVYPRFLGVAPFVRFSAPDFPGIDTFAILMIYPPGREDSLEIPRTPYRLVFRLASPGSGTGDQGPGNAKGVSSDPYETGAFVFLVRVEKGGSPVAELTVPAGGAAQREGCIVAIPEVKRMVAADFIRDNGVPLIWLSLVSFTAALLWYLPVRTCFPRREILVIEEGHGVRTFSRAEGRWRTHAGVYHGLLDGLEGEPEQPVT